MDLVQKHEEVAAVLRAMRGQGFWLLPADMRREDVAWLDLSIANEPLQALPLEDTRVLEDYVFGEMEERGAVAAAGGFNEHRGWYRRSPLFRNSAEDVRCVHLGVDVWVEEGTPLSSPLDGRIHSFQNNAHFGDYGPTIIVEHEVRGLSFYCLYGHLAAESLAGKWDGQVVKRGDLVGWVGNRPGNGDWPPHVHFQIMIDMLGLRGDYPGVASLSRREEFMTLCLDPNLLLGIPALERPDSETAASLRGRGETVVERVER